MCQVSPAAPAKRPAPPPQTLLWSGDSTLFGAMCESLALQQAPTLLTDTQIDANTHQTTL